MFDTFTAKEQALLRSLHRPAAVQDFLNELPMNFRDDYLSPLQALRSRTAQCMEGAMLAAVAFRFHGRPPLILDLVSAEGDDDHVVALFRERGYWGAVSKTNHAMLRYREPIYRTIRELALSYFHEYFLDDGRKTLRSYSRPVNLTRFDARGWMTSPKPVAYIPAYLFTVPHTRLLEPWQMRSLRKADLIEREAGKLVEWRKRARSL